ncbi:MAG: biotin transporter BioY [Clostridia bacterium]|nr:biotin transporter BioY [Clostridia bacterium]
MSAKKPLLSARDMAYVALGAALIAVCAWISIPAAVPFTLQTFGVFCVLIILGGKRGTLSLLIYLLLGLVGLPVFSGMRGGPAALLGPTGGYILGFLLTGLCYLLAEKLVGKKLLYEVVALVLGLVLCYAFGTVWFIHTYSAGEMTLNRALSLCVWPFIPIDAGKMLLAFLIGCRVRKAIKA